MSLPPFYRRGLLWILSFWIVLLCYSAVGVWSKYVEGHLVTPENWAFVARFCFLSEEGQFEFKIEYDAEYAVQNLLLYYDSNRQWPAVYKTNKTCEQKEAVLNMGQNQVVNLTEHGRDTGCISHVVPPPAKKNGSSVHGGGPGRKQQNLAAHTPRKTIISCHNVRKFRSARERWWFLAISNCNATKGLNLRYRFLMTNGPPGDYWHEHFSADEFYILPVLMFFVLAYMLMIIAIVMCTVELRSRQLLHTTYKLFMTSVFLQEGGIFLQSIAYIRYAVDGVGFPRTRQMGRLLEAGSETCFLLLLLLLAKGYTVTRGRLRVGSSIKLTIFMCLYVVTYTTLFIYEREFFDPGEVLYLFESPAGYGLMILRIVAWWMFVYSTVFTLKHYPEKATFYYPFNLLATLWFVAGPCFIMSANSLIDKWVRESVVYAVLHTIAFVGHLQFLILTRPSKANKNFPFHVRTTQIAVMETAGVAGSSSLYHFGHHAYAPGGPYGPAPMHRPTSPMADWMRDVPVELFTVSRAVAIDMRAPSAPPTTPPGTAHSIRTTTFAANGLPANGLALGPDMAGGDARVADGRESPPGAGDREGASGGSGGSRSTPKDPQMFVAPSQRRQPSGGSVERDSQVAEEHGDDEDRGSGELGPPPPYLAK